MLHIRYRAKVRAQTSFFDEARGLQVNGTRDMGTLVFVSEYSDVQGLA